MSEIEAAMIAEQRAQLLAGIERGGGETGEQRRERRIAETFQHDEGMERLLHLRDTDPVGYRRISTPHLDLQLGMYAEQKAITRKVVNK